MSWHAFAPAQLHATLCTLLHTAALVSSHTDVRMRCGPNKNAFCVHHMAAPSHRALSARNEMSILSRSTRSAHTLRREWASALMTSPAAVQLWYSLFCGVRALEGHHWYCTLSFVMFNVSVDE
ncbi:hypothetical protein OH77DRAFT_974899 [Trametes cingulata]|nr:hypothetical protein OH77DRAFT_974899 [Trametes cingulata]